jgi:hypothetical protein
MAALGGWNNFSETVAVLRFFAHFVEEYERKTPRHKIYGIVDKFIGQADVHRVSGEAETRGTVREAV